MPDVTPAAERPMRLFGTDGVRGVVGEPPMTAEIAMQIGRALAYLLRGSHQGRAGRVILGKDTRLSGYMLESALAAGICSMGSDVWLCGPIPTPAVAHLTTSMNADAGVVVSASHNPYQDNGIKIFGADGFKLADDREAEIERWVASGELAGARPPDGRVGKARRIDDARGRYVAFLKSLFPRARSLDGLRIVVDCAHGAAYRAAPEVLEELGATVLSLGVAPNGTNINQGCGALHPEAAARAVLEHGAQMALALDGDADRVILVDERGEVVDGDEIMAILATRMLAAGTLRGGTLVATVMSNMGLETALGRAGGKLLRTPVGDRSVVEAMRKGPFNFGGEQSGHIIDLDRGTTGDGLAAALRILEVVVREERPLSELRRVMTRLPQVLVNVALAARPATPVEELPEVARRIRDVERALADQGRVLVRASGTEPKVRVMVEAQDLQSARAYAFDIAAAVERGCATGGSGES